MVQPIGFIDSGVGGLTVVREALKQLPNESIIYLGDSARCPYGPRPQEEVKQFTWEMVRFLLEKKVKMIVIACNTATAVALDEIRANVSVPVIGVIHPGSLAAIKKTKTGKIAVLGTQGTIQSGVYEKILKEKDHQVMITNIACPKFVTLVESSQRHSSIAKKVVAETLQPIVHGQVDTVILGCTHFPLLRSAIQNVVGENVQLIDSGAETLTAVSTLLDYFNIAATYEENPTPRHDYYTTSSPELFKSLAEDWLGREIHVEKVKITE